jgi:hypothetical protein
MTIISVLLGLIVGLVVYFVLTAVIHFQHSTLLFGLLAVLVGVAIAFNGVGGNWFHRGPGNAPPNG